MKTKLTEIDNTTHKSETTVENVANGPHEDSKKKPCSTNPTASLKLHEAVYPENTWLTRYLDYARSREESADCFLLGSILPVISVILGRRVWFPWAERRIYPNLFTMLAGKPGDRKSSAINLAEKVARSVIDERHFLPDAMSVEAMFAEYDEKAGGSPDKILIADDANPFLGMLQKTNYGERVGQGLLRMFDCKGLGEAFLRNKRDSECTAQRSISETSTSMVLGATFNICQFQGHDIRSGLQRRFLYYIAESHGRFIPMPNPADQKMFRDLCDRLARLKTINNVELQFAPGAIQVWHDFQKQNREKMHVEGFGATYEAYCARLNGQPDHVIKIAVLFQAALWAETTNKPEDVIETETLNKAIEHTELCLLSAQALDSIGNRSEIRQDAEVLLSHIVKDFEGTTYCDHGIIHLARTTLTRKYAHHSGRRGAWRPDDLYIRIIPELIRHGNAREIPRIGKQSSYEFKQYGTFAKTGKSLSEEEAKI